MADFPPENPVPRPGGDAVSGDICAECKTPITGVYYRLKRAMVCGGCADRMQRGLPQDRHSAYVRAVLFGLVGFGIGMTVYAAFVIVTEISIGYLALAVGWIIGKAMMIGSKGIGGRRYQITAVLLTYAAVSMAIIPIAVSMVITKKKIQPHQIVRQAPADLSTGQPGNSPSAVPPQQPDSQSKSSATKPATGVFTLLGKLAMFGLASPFLELTEGLSGVIGMLILLVGMQFAWKMTAGPPKIALEGPYDLSASTSGVDWRNWD